MSRFGKPPVLHPHGTTPRLDRIFVCDVYNVTLGGIEQLITRRTYSKIGTAKGLRTTRQKYWDAYLRRIQNYPNSYRRIFIGDGRDPRNEVVAQRYDVYELTPYGHITIS